MIIENMIGGIASAVFATAAIFFLNWKMALIMLVLMPLLMVVMGLITPFMQKASQADKQNDETNRSMMQEYLSRIILIKTYYMQKKILSNVKDTYERKLKSGMKLGMWEGLATFSGLLVSMAMFMTALGIGAYFVLRGEATVGSLIAIVQLLNYIVMPLEKFAGTISQVSQAIASSGRIGEIYEMQADGEVWHNEPVNALTLTAENICFAYGDDNENVLDNLNITFEKGAVTGIVGKSGCGKSTLLKLLIGLYEPNKGKVTLTTTDGSGADVISQVAYVPPNDYLFSGTVTENIIMSEDQPRIDEMKAACLDANILDFIASLPGGFDTIIGESGGTVSSGQAQRLAIARAIYKKSPIVVFDEPTANLDADSIAQFKLAVNRLAHDKGKICVVVTHDTSTMTVCDKVYAMEDGVISEKMYANTAPQTDTPSHTP